MNISRPGLLWLPIWLLLSLLISLTAHASNFSVLIDQDRNAATGCSVTLPGSAPVNGADVRLDAVVDRTALVTVTTVNLASCNAATQTFDATTTRTTNIPVGLNIGLAASDVVEFDAPLADLGLTPGEQVNLAVTAAAPGQTGSVQATVSGVTIPGGTTPPVGPANIPTLSEYGLIVMILLMAVVLWRQRRGWAAGLMLILAPLLVLAANHLSDGLIGDWVGETPIATNPGAGQLPTDVRQVFIAQEGGQFFVRLDVTELERSAPTLKVSASGPTRMVEGQTASLHAVADNANGAVTYQWQQTGGTPVTLSGATDPGPTFVAPATTVPLSLIFEVTATDTVKTATARVETVVQPDRIAVDAGQDRTVPPGVLVTLHANGQSDGPGPFTYTWRQIFPETPQVALTGADTANPRFTAPEHGSDPTVYEVLDNTVTLVFEVAFSDGLKSASDRVTVVRQPLVQPAQPGSPLTTLGPSQQQSLVVVAPPSRNVAVPTNGATELLSAAASGGDSNYVWLWKVKGKAGPGPDLKDSDLLHADGPTVSVPLPVVPGPTTYAFEVEVRDQGGAGRIIASDSTSLFAYPASSIAPNPLSVFGPPVTVNEGAFAPLSALASGGTSPYRYVWSQVSGAPVVIDDANAATAHFTAPATTGGILQLTFAVTVTDAAGATADTTVTVTVNDVATPSLQPLALTVPPPATTLTGTPVNLVANATGGDQAYTWQWTQTGGPAATLSGTDTARLTVTTPTVTARQTLTFQVTVTDGTGAQQQGAATLTLDPVPTQAPNPLSVFGPPVTVNEGAFAPLSALASGGTSPYAYAWSQVSGAPVVIDDANAATAHFTAPATTGSSLQLTFTVTVTDAAGATADTTVTVTVNDVATPSLQPLALTVPPPATALTGTPVNLVANATGGDRAYTWQWTQTGGPAATLSGADTARLTVDTPTVTTRQTLTFQVTVTDGTGAQQQGTVTLTVDPSPAQAPLSVFGPPVTVNEGALAPLTAIASGGTSPYRYAWRQTGGTPSVTLQDATTATAFFTAPATTGSPLQLTFAVTVTDAAGATADTTVTATVNDVATPSLQPLALTVPPPATALTGTPVNLVANATGGDQAYTWQWTQTGGPAATLSGTDTARLTVTTPTVTTRQTLTFQVTVTDGTGASQQGAATVTLDPAPTQAPNPLSVFGPPVTVNEGALAPLSALASGGTSPYTYAWRQTGGTPSVTLQDATTATAFFTAPATTGSPLQLTFAVTVTDAAGATADTTVTATVNDVATPSLQPLALTVPPPATALNGIPVNLVANATGGDRAYTWQWTQTSGPAVTLSGADTARLTVTTPTVTARTTLTVQVTVTDGAGASQQGTVTLTVDPSPAQAPLSVFAPSVAAGEGPIAVTMSASGQGGTGPYTYVWTQTAGPTVTLSGANTATATFQPPAVDVDTTLTFEVTVRDSTGAAFAKAMNVLIRNTFALTPPQVLRLQPLPTVETLAGTSVRLAVGVTGGVPPYAWAWQQTGGSAASLAGQTTDTLTVTPIAGAPTETLAFQVTVTDSASPSVSEAETVQVKVLATPSTQPLSVAQIPSPHVDEGAAVALPVVAQGGTGNYQYQWTFNSAPSGSTITSLPLTDATTSIVRFTAPQVSARTVLDFTLTVTDGVSTVRKENLSVIVNDLIPPLELNLANPNPLTAHSGDTVALTPGTARGGQGPYTYAWRQTAPATPQVTFTGGDTPNPSFTAPTVTASTVFTFEMTVTDALGNQQTVRETVTVDAATPTTAPLKVTLTGPATVTAGDTLTLNGTATGGTTDFTNNSTGYTHVRYFTPGADTTTWAGGATSADLNPSGTVKRVFSGPLVIELQVTDFATPPVTARVRHTVQVLAADLSRPGSLCLVCGGRTGVVGSNGDLGLDPANPCSDWDLVLADQTKCPDTKPYCMNDIVQHGLQVDQWRRCVTEQVCDLLWWNATSDDPLCLHFDPSSPADDLSCHLCCYGDGCNIDVNPPDGRLYRP